MSCEVEVDECIKNVDTVNSKHTKTNRLIHCVLKRHHHSNDNNHISNDNMNQNRSGIGMIASMLMKSIHSSCSRKKNDYQLSFSLQKLQKNNKKKNCEDDDTCNDTKSMVVYDEILLFVARKMNVHTYVIYKVEENNNQIMIGTLIRHHDNISYVTYDLYDCKKNIMIATILYRHVASKIMPLLLSSSKTKQPFSSSMVLSSLTRKAEFAIAVTTTKTNSIDDSTRIQSSDNNKSIKVSNKKHIATSLDEDIVTNDATLNSIHDHHNNHDNWFEVECSKRLQQYGSLLQTTSKAEEKYDSAENNKTTINYSQDHRINVFQTKEPYVKQKCDGHDELNANNNNNRKKTKTMKKTIVGLNFHGRGRMASSKNIQFISVGSHHDIDDDNNKMISSSTPTNNNSNTIKKKHDNKVMYQMSKWDENVFHVDYSVNSHIEMIHAFALGIAQLDL